MPMSWFAFVQNGIIRVTALILFGLTTSLLLSAGVVSADDEAKAPNLVVNGSFENGMEGWGYEQWADKPVPGEIDKTEKAQDGSVSFKMGLAGASGARYMAQEVVPVADQGYLLTLWVKCKDVPDNAIHVRVGIENRGWLGSETGQFEFAQTGGTHDWKQFKVPIPASAIGDSKKLTLFIYDDQMGQGFAWFDAVSIKTASDKELGAAASDPDTGNEMTLTGDTSKPNVSTFVLGEKVELDFHVVHMPSEQTDVNLQLSIVDEHDQPIDSREILVRPDASGQWQTTVEAPHAKLGFYRVKAHLSDGTELSPRGSRKAGFLTYAVVPDPAKRVNYGEDESMFGMQGGFGPWGEEVMAYLGARWSLDSSLQWNDTEPDHAGQFASAVAAGKFAARSQKWKWQTFTLPTLMAAPKWPMDPATRIYMTGTLTPEGEVAWAAYCKEAARVYAQWNPDRAHHIYQITWEPIYPWGFKGKDEDLVRIYEIAYAALHEADPKALVAGPTQGIKLNDTGMTIRLLKLGLAKYIDVYSVHPYFAIEPERDGMVPAIRHMRDALVKAMGKPIPMIGTEQGWTTGEDISKELTHARGLMRQNLITLGEGYQFNFAFYVVDYLLGDQKGYGYYYNLVKGQPSGPAKVGPKPIVPAYAAQSFLLDGHKSVGAIEWLGDTALGYAFQRDQDVVLALWDYGDKPRQVTLMVGTGKGNGQIGSAKVYDWMGNELAVPNDAGSVTVTLTPEPIYIAGVSPDIWGAGAGKMLLAGVDHVQSYPGRVASVGATLKASADEVLDGTLVLEADPKLNLKPVTQNVSVAAGQLKAVSFDLNVAPDVNPAPYPLRMTLRNRGGVILAMAGAKLQVVPPVAIVGIAPVVVPGAGQAVAVELKDQEGKGASGMLDFKLDGVPQAARQMSFNLAPGATQRVLITYPDLKVSPSQAYQASTTVTVGNGGREYALAAPINFLTARHVGSPLPINDDPSKWASFPNVNLAGNAMVIRAPESFDGKLSADIRYAWDEQSLYLFADVVDTSYQQDFTGMDIWKADCLQLAFNLDPTKQESVTGNALDVNALRRAMEINVALTKQGPAAYRSVTYDAAGFPIGDLSQEQFKLAVKHDNGRLIYEMAIPWKTLGATAPPKEGDLVGVALAVNSVDAPDQKAPTALGLFGGIYPTKDSGKFGLLLLGSDGNKE